MTDLKDMPEEIWVYEGAYDDHTWIPHEDGYTGKGGGTLYRRAELVDQTPIPDEIPQDAKAALDAVQWFCNQCDHDDEADQPSKDFIAEKAETIRRSLTANAALTERVRVLEGALNEVRKGVHPQFVLNRLITEALDAGKGA